MNFSEVFDFALVSQRILRLSIFLGMGFKLRTFKNFIKIFVDSLQNFSKIILGQSEEGEMSSSIRADDIFRIFLETPPYFALNFDCLKKGSLF